MGTAVIGGLRGSGWEGMGRQAKLEMLLGRGRAAYEPRFPLSQGSVVLHRMAKGWPWAMLWCEGGVHRLSASN